MSAVDQTAATWGSAAVEELAVTPFEALRVSFGMLLGAEDFRTLMGNPRGKLMLHSSWLHGSGVVWGFPIDRADDGQLRVGAGLAVDHRGRELALQSPRCVDVAEWVKEQRKNGSPTTGSTHPCPDPEVTVACLVATYDLCPTRPVPALADPCDQQRTSTEPSRLVETVCLELRPYECPAPPTSGPYHRVRVLLGLDEVGSPDNAGKQAADALQAVLREPRAMRARALLAAFRRLLAADVTDLRPDDIAGNDVFPLPEEQAAVPLATISITGGSTGAYSTGLAWEPDLTVRRGLIATSTVQELACGPAAGLLGGRSGQDAGGPRVIRDSIGWEDGGATLVFTVDKPLRRATLSRNQVIVSSLGSGGWDREDIDEVHYDDTAGQVRVKLSQPPGQPLVRLVVLGTGSTPVTGMTGIPLAGLDDGPAGTEDDGHDAVLRIDRGTP